MQLQDKAVLSFFFYLFIIYRAVLRIIVAHFPVDGWLILQQMLKGHCSIHKTIKGWELDKYKLILCAGEDTGKVLKIAIGVKQLQGPRLVFVITPVLCSLLSSAFELDLMAKSTHPFSKKNKQTRKQFNQQHCLCLTGGGLSGYL